MEQMFFYQLEADVLASSIRSQKNLCEELIRELEGKDFDSESVNKKIYEIESALKKICKAA
ncbi:MAG: hypothetical protein ACKVQC_11090 [Elusimicrobiota bacterium]